MELYDKTAAKILTVLFKEPLFSMICFSITCGMDLNGRKRRIVTMISIGTGYFIKKVPHEIFF